MTGSPLEAWVKDLKMYFTKRMSKWLVNIC